jgi:anti-sigma factor ChrR (cupin superfamily)
MTDSTRRGEPGFVFTDAGQTPFRASTFAAKVCVKDLGAVEGRSMQLVRFEPGAVFPLHIHRGPEFVYVLEGELIQRGRRLGPGWASVAATDSIDDDVHSECGCTFLTVYSE